MKFVVESLNVARPNIMKAFKEPQAMLCPPRNTPLDSEGVLGDSGGQLIVRGETLRRGQRPGPV